MDNGTDQQWDSEELEKFVDNKIDNYYKNKLKSYRVILKAFFYGFGFFIIVLVSLGLITKKNGIILLHDTVFSVKSQLEEELTDKVSVSYVNQFWLGSSENDYTQEFIPLYASDDQKVEARIYVYHSNPDPKLKVKIWLDELETDPVWEDVEDLDFEHFSLTEFIRKTGHNSRSRPPNVHVVNFKLVGDKISATNDRIDVRVMINVYGIEKKALIH